MNALLTLRERRGWTQEELAEKSSVSARTIGMLENGQSKPHMPTRRRLLQALGFPVRDHRMVFGPIRKG